MKKSLRPRTAADRFLYAKKYCRCLFNQDFGELLTFSTDKQRHVAEALSALSKFVGVYELFRTLFKNYGLKWSVNNDDLIISRFSRTSDPNEISRWIKEVRQKCPELSDFLDLMVMTGLRFEEAVNSYDLIIKLARQGNLQTYYDEDREILLHYKFREIFIRRTKKAFVSFVLKDLVQRISENELLRGPNRVKKLIQRRGLRQRFSDIRELQGTLISKHLSEVEISFLHGRISTNVFMRNYFNPALIGDLKERVFKAIADLKVLTE